MWDYRHMYGFMFSAICFQPHVPPGLCVYERVFVHKCMGVCVRAHKNVLCSSMYVIICEVFACPHICINVMPVHECVHLCISSRV